MLYTLQMPSRLSRCRSDWKRLSTRKRRPAWDLDWVLSFSPLKEGLENCTLDRGFVSKAKRLDPLSPQVTPALSGDPYAIVTLLQFDTRFSRLHMVADTIEPGGPRVLMAPVLFPSATSKLMLSWLRSMAVSNMPTVSTASWWITPSTCLHNPGLQP